MMPEAVAFSMTVEPAPDPDLDDLAEDGAVFGGGEDDDGDFFEVRGGAEDAEQGDAIHVGEADVGDDQVGARSLEVSGKQQMRVGDSDRIARTAMESRFEIDLRPGKRLKAARCEFTGEIQCATVNG